MQSFYTTLLIGIFLLVGLGVSGQSEGLDSLSRGERLFQEAEILEKEKKWEAAIEKYDEVLKFSGKQKNKLLFEKVSRRLHKIVVKNPNEERTEYYEKTLSLSINIFSDTSEITGLWYLLTAYILSSSMKFEKAKKYNKEALRILNNKEGWHDEILAVITELGVIQMQTANFPAADSSFQNSLKFIETIFLDGKISEEQYDREKAAALGNLGLVKKEQGKYGEAISLYKDAVPILKKNNDKKLLGINYYNIGVASIELNQAELAKEYFEKTIFCFEESLDKEHYFFGIVYNYLGLAHDELNEMEKAIENGKKSLEINRINWGDDHVRIAHSYGNLGQYYSKLSDYKNAENFVRKSLKIYQKNFTEPHPNTVASYLSLAKIWRDQEIKYDSMMIISEIALKDALLIYGDKHPDVAKIYNHLAHAYQAKGDNANTLLYSQKSLIANSYFNDLNYSKNPEFSDYINPFEALPCLTQKLIILQKSLEMNNNDSLLKENFEICLQSFDELISYLIKNSNERYLKDSETLPNLELVSKLAVKQYNKFHKKKPSDTYLKKIFYWLERWKGQQLLLSFQQSDALSTSKIPNNLVEEDQEQLGRIADLEKDLFLAVEAKDSDRISTIRNEYLFEEKRKREDFIAKLEMDYPDYFQLKYDLSITHIETIQHSLKDNTILLELIVTNDETYTLAISNSEKQIFSTNLIPNQNEKITTLNTLLRSHNLLRADRRRKFIKLSHELYQQFIQPIEHLLEGKERLVIVGEGVTHYLPFEALLKSNEDKPWHELDFLIKDHEISYHYSGTLFARAQEQETNFDNELLAFAPVFSEADSTLTALRGAGLVMADTTFRSVEGDGFSPLPHSEKEVKNIQKLFPKSAQTTTLLGKAASEKNLKSALEQNHRFVHIASHSFANIDYPKFSGIACASDSTSQDGILYVGEIYNLAVNSDLVVLSSCESGVGKLLGGEGMLGLNRSFVYAGVPNVIFSLWKVYDEMTGDMMTEFYKNTLQGQSYSKALRAAKLKMLEDPKMAAPDIWAAFLLVGR